MNVDVNWPSAKKVGKLNEVAFGDMIHYMKETNETRVKVHNNYGGI